MTSTHPRLAMLASFLLVAACGGSAGDDPSITGSDVTAPSTPTSGAAAAHGGSGGTSGKAGSGGRAGGSSLALGGSTSTDEPCTSDADCDDGDPCTIDACVAVGGGEVGSSTCNHDASTDPACKGTAGAAGAGGAGGAGGSGGKGTKKGGAGTGGAGTAGAGAGGHTGTAGAPAYCDPSDASCMPPPVDTCPTGCFNGGKVYPPPKPLVTEMPSCPGGFELNNPKDKGPFVVPAKSASGASGGQLAIDIATYLEPDHITISAVDAAGNKTPLVDTCRMQTADYADPTDGCSRPPDDSIRQYVVQIPPGTRSLVFDFTAVCSPIYLRVLGLCEFDVQPFFTGCHWRALP